MARVSMLGAIPAIALAALFVAGGGSRTEWLALSACAIAVIVAAQIVKRSVSHVLNTMANVVSAVHDGDFSVRGKSHRDHEDVAFAFNAINSLADVLREQRLSAFEATALLRKVIEAIDASIFAFDEDRRLRVVNPAGERLLGKHAERLMGRSAEELSIDAWLSGESPRKVIVDLPGGKGAWELRHGVFRQGGRAHTLVVVADVSRLLREEERQAWRNIIRVVSHEVNNSLAPIASIAQGLTTALERPAPPAVADLESGLGVISRRSASLKRFMENYGRLARLPAPELETIDVEAWLHRVARLEQRVPVRLRGTRNVIVEADEGLVEQALINLVQNAADASIAAQTPIEIEWSLDERRELTILVMDNGPGIADSAALFVPFFTTKPAGTGIGLVLSREIIESHDGRLTLENRKDAKGCVAKIVLPRARLR
jgi:PAS domain S-box-containing protein